MSNTPHIDIIPLDRYNWEQTLKIKLNPEQRFFTPTVLYSLAQARFENLIPFGISFRSKIVGLIMYGEFGGICWINRIIIGQNFQNQGIGQAALKQIIKMLQQKRRCREIRTSFVRENKAAQALFESAGFRAIQKEAFSEEIVMVYVGT